MIPLNHQVTVIMVQNQIDRLPPELFDLFLQPGDDAEAESY